MVFEVYTTQTFDKEVEKLDKTEQDRIIKIYSQLKDNPKAGDTVRYDFFREKRIQEKRVYYLVYEDLNLVLLVAISGKKDQQKTIDYIIKYFDDFRKYAQNLKKLSNSSDSSHF